MSARRNAQPWFLIASVALSASASSCDSDDAEVKAAGGSGGTSSTGAAGTTTGSEAGAGGSQAASFDCSAATDDVEKVVCAAEGFLGTLSDTELASVNLEYSDSADRTRWSNLPGVVRAGAQMSALSTPARAAALAFMETVLSENGASDLLGVLAADDYLGTQSSGGMGGPGGGGAQYSSDNYYVAIFGTPTTTGNWGIAYGGHHMAYNITYLDGVGYPVPNHIGVEPKASFTLNGTAYAPLSDEGSAMLAVFGSLSTAELASAFLQGQTFADVLIGPVEYGTGSADASKAKFPTGDNRTGVLVSSLSTAQQAVVTTAIEAWVGDYNPRRTTTMWRSSGHPPRRGTGASRTERLYVPGCVRRHAGGLGRDTTIGGRPGRERDLHAHRRAARVDRALLPGRRGHSGPDALPQHLPGQAVRLRG
jgi:hypothetical protein